MSKERTHLDGPAGRSRAVRAEAEQLAEEVVAKLDELVNNQPFPDIGSNVAMRVVRDALLKWGETQYQQGRAAGMVPTCVACVNGDHVQCLGGRCECIHDPISSSR